IAFVACRQAAVLHGGQEVVDQDRSLLPDGGAGLRIRGRARIAEGEDLRPLRVLQRVGVGVDVPVGVVGLPHRAVLDPIGCRRRRPDMEQTSGARVCCSVLGSTSTYPLGSSAFLAGLSLIQSGADCGGTTWSMS